MPKPRPPKKTNGHEQAVSPAGTAPGLNTDQAPEKFAVAPPAATDERNSEMKTATLKKTRKPEIVRSESRSNLIPINVEEEVRRLAYLLSERRGFEPGHETEDWLSAEREILDRYHHQSA